MKTSKTVAAIEASPNGGVTLDEVVHARLCDAIAEGVLSPGQHLRAGRLAKEMSVSRTPVVNALKRLSQAGLVEWVANSGAYVRRFSMLETAQIFELREVLEGLAARHAARNLSERAIDELDALFVDFRGDAGEEAGPRIVRAYLAKDRLFHRSIIEAAGSAPLSRTTDQVHVTTVAFSAGLIRTVSVGIAEHDQIVAAFRARDPEAAEVAMRKHLRRSVDWLYEEAEVERERSRA